MEKKVTKKDVLEAITKVVEDGLSVNVSSGVIVTASDIVDYAEKTIAQLNAKAFKAAEKAAEKKAKGDDLREAVKAVLTDDYQVTLDILAKVENFPEVTRSKVTARLTQLVKAGVAEKAPVKTEDGKQAMAYRLNDKAEAVEAEAEEFDAE